MIADLGEQYHLEMLENARSLAQGSRCEKMRFGCLLITEGGLFAGSGFNESVRPERCCVRVGVKSGTCLERCFAVHAEQMALLMSRRQAHSPVIAYVAGYYPDGREWVSDGFYCTFCVRLLREAGVRWVVMPSQGDGVLVQHIEEAVDFAYDWALGVATA